MCGGSQCTIISVTSESIKVDCTVKSSTTIRPIPDSAKTLGTPIVPDLISETERPYTEKTTTYRITTFRPPTVIRKTTTPFDLPTIDHTTLLVIKSTTPSSKTTRERTTSRTTPSVNIFRPSTTPKIAPFTRSTTETSISDKPRTTTNKIKTTPDEFIENWKTKETKRPVVTPSIESTTPTSKFTNNIIEIKTPSVRTTTEQIRPIDNWLTTFDGLITPTEDEGILGVFTERPVATTKSSEKPRPDVTTEIIRTIDEWLTIKPLTSPRIPFTTISTKSHKNWRTTPKLGETATDKDRTIKSTLIDRDRTRYSTTETNWIVTKKIDTDVVITSSEAPEISDSNWTKEQPGVSEFPHTSPKSFTGFTTSKPITTISTQKSHTRFTSPKHVSKFTTLREKETTTSKPFEFFTTPDFFTMFSISPRTTTDSVFSTREQTTLSPRTTPSITEKTVIDTITPKPTVKVPSRNLTDVTSIDCTGSLECPRHQSCINGQCLDPCQLTRPCGSGFVCKVSNHLVLCLCPTGSSTGSHCPKGKHGIYLQELCSPLYIFRYDGFWLFCYFCCS